MPAIQLDPAILYSSLWLDRDARDLFLTAFLLAEPYEAAKPVPQFRAYPRSETGWSVPPGRYGLADVATVCLFHRAGIEQSAALEALERVGATDQAEKPALVCVADGFLLLSYLRFEPLRSALDADGWRSIVAFYGGLCAYCEEEPWTDVEHRVPLSRGGKHDLSNVVPACRSCNSSKGTQIWEPARRHPLLV